MPRPRAPPAVRGCGLGTRLRSCLHGTFVLEIVLEIVPKIDSWNVLEIVLEIVPEIVPEIDPEIVPEIDPWNVLQDAFP